MDHIAHCRRSRSRYMMSNPLLFPVLTARVTPPGTCFGLKLCGSCCELLSCSVFYRTYHCSYYATYCTVTMITTGLLISLAIGTPLRPNAAHAHFACNCLLSSPALSSMLRDRTRDATQYRGTPGGHTLPVITYSVSSIRLASRSRRAAASQNERPSIVSARC